MFAVFDSPGPGKKNENLFTLSCRIRANINQIFDWIENPYELHTLSAGYVGCSFVRSFHSFFHVKFPFSIVVVAVAAG